MPCVKNSLFVLQILFVGFLKRVQGTFKEAFLDQKNDTFCGSRAPLKFWKRQMKNAQEMHKSKNKKKCAETPNKCKKRKCV